MMMRTEAERARELSALNFLNPWECDRHDIPSRASVVRRLSAACRQMLVDVKQNGKLARFDDKRHDAFLAVLDVEKSELAELRRIAREQAAGVENIRLFDATRNVHFLRFYEANAERVQLTRNSPSAKETI